jgi:hypothetical protein
LLLTVGTGHRNDDLSGARMLGSAFAGRLLLTVGTGHRNDDLLGLAC